MNNFQLEFLLWCGFWYKWWLNRWLTAFNLEWIKVVAILFNIFSSLSLFLSLSASKLSLCYFFFFTKTVSKPFKSEAMTACKWFRFVVCCMQIFGAYLSHRSGIQFFQWIESYVENKMLCVMLFCDICKFACFKFSSSCDLFVSFVPFYENSSSYN